MNPKLRRNIKLDYLCTFLTNLNMQSSVWVLYLAYCQMSLMQIGILEGIYHATSIICEIPSGALADLVGRKKSMILSRICVTISCMIMLFSRSFWLFALSFVIQAWGNNLNSGSEEALVYDSMKCLSEENLYIKINGRINTIIEISQAIATVAGGILAEYSYVWCYGACVIISLLALLPVFLMMEPPFLENSVSQEQSGGWQMVIRHFKISFKILRGDLRILKIIVYFSMVFAAYTLLFFYSQQYYFDFGYSKIEISMIFLLAGIVSCLGALLSEKLYRRLGKGISVISAFSIAIALICCGFQKPVISILIFVIAGFFNSALYPVESEALNTLIPSEQRATLISVNSMFFSIMMIIMFPVAGALADKWGLSWILMILGILLLFFVAGWNWRWGNVIISMAQKSGQRELEDIEDI